MLSTVSVMRSIIDDDDSNNVRAPHSKSLFTLRVMSVRTKRLRKEGRRGCTARKKVNILSKKRSAKKVNLFFKNYLLHLVCDCPGGGADSALQNVGGKKRAKGTRVEIKSVAGSH